MMADGCSSCDLCLPSARVPADSPTVWVVTQQHPARTTDVDSKYVRTRDAKMDPESIN